MEIQGVTVGDTLNRFHGLQAWGYRGYECGDTGYMVINTYYRLHGVTDMVIQVIQLEIHPASYRGYARGDTGVTKLQ